MKKQSKLTSSELSNWLALYQSLATLVVFFAGFVFVTIPLVIFSADVSSLYGRLVLYFLLASILIFTTMMDLYHFSTLQVYVQSSPNTFRIMRKYKNIDIADTLMIPAQFFAFSSISFMLLLKGQEFAAEALVWFLITIGRIILSLYIIRRTFKTAK